MSNEEEGENAEAGASWIRWAWISFALLVPLLGFLLAYATVDPAPPNTIRMATGAKGGAYHRYGLLYREALAKHGIELQLQTSQGTQENLELLEAGKVEIAFVQGGVGTAKEHPQLRALASLYYEPLWVFLPASSKGVSELGDLAGKTLAVGSKGSGTRAVATRLLELNEVKATLSPLGGQAGKDALLAGEIDALFLIGSPTIELIESLLEEPLLRPLPFRRAEAYSRRVRYLSPITLPEGVIDLRQNVPAADVPLVATVASLAVRTEDFHPAFTDLVLPIARKLHGKGGVLETPGAFPSEHRLDYPLTDEANRYFQFGLPFLHRYLPFWAANLVSRFKVMLLPLLTLAIPLFEVLPPVYDWRQGGKLRKLYGALRKLEKKGCTAQDLDALTDKAWGVPLPPSYFDKLYEFLAHVEEARRRIPLTDAAASGPQAAARAGEPGDQQALAEVPVTEETQTDS